MQVARRFEEKCAVVTGGASGIGRATVERLAAEGARVLVADWSARRGEPTAEELTAQGFDVAFQLHDAGDEASWARIGERVRSEYGCLHLLVNNAYSGVAANLETLTPQVLRDCMRVNVEGAVLGMQLAAKLMDAGGAIVNLASIAAFSPSTTNLGYGAAKATLVHLTQSAALGLARRNPPIRVNAVAPGSVNTPALRSTMRATNGLSKEDDLQPVLDAASRGTPLGRIADPAELASAIAFLLSDDASYVTGQCLRVDGGASLR